jgi:hypothetical protein
MTFRAAGLYACVCIVISLISLVHCVIDLAPGEFDGKDRHISI